MLKMDSFQAKTHFADLLRKVSQGEEVLITNRGKVVAKVSPFSGDGPDPALFIQKMKTFSRGRKCYLQEIQDMKAQGRQRR